MVYKNNAFIQHLGKMQNEEIPMPHNLFETK
jgi:hypothetical protein